MIGNVNPIYIVESEKDGINLINYLQDPLQPYADNLLIYDLWSFRKWHFKYDEYQEPLGLFLGILLFSIFYIKMTFNLLNS